MIQFLGAIGFGLVWGWLLGFFVSRRPSTQPFLNFLASALATILAACVPLIFVNLRAVIAFVAAMALTFFIHYLWRTEQRKRAAVASH